MYFNRLKQKNYSGFTIAELVIVIIVIGVLATIVVVAYDGVSKRAVETSMVSDLDNISASMEAYSRLKGSYPSSSSAVSLQASGTNQLSYILKPYGYCTSITNTETTKTYFYKSFVGKVEDGNCDIAVSSLAGSIQGSQDGTGSSARFSGPLGVAADKSGTIYVADYYNHRIRKIVSSGAVTTLAGSSAGYNNATGTAARFNYPASIAVDADGDIYVADRYNHRIRKVTPSGAVTLFAGSGTPGNVNATGAAAQFNNPMDLAFDSQGNLFVVEREGQVVRKITPGGVVTTLAGSTQGYAEGTGTAAQFNNPVGLTVDRAGNVYVADEYNQRIRKITPLGVVTTFAGTGTIGDTDGAGTSAQFNYPRDVAVDSEGNLYVADNGSNRIRFISPTGTVSTYAGRSYGYGSADGNDTTATFGHPSGITIDDSWNLYITDHDTHRVRKIVQ